ncbi:MAG: acyltransferase [Proteobacteria bacterium]|nr:acyltransferase [Pseudomonadota bacterium]
MDPVSPLPAIVSLFVALVTASLIVRKFGVTSDQGRFASIDGLRGYLAFFVFLHHACIWYFYLRTGKWALPPSNLYTHFGQSSVVFFFMITGFLFFSKLLNGRISGVDWGRLFVSRFLRLVPLYFFLIILFFLLVAYFSKGRLLEPAPKLIYGMIKWLGFRVLGAPDLNGIKNLSLPVASITWSLPYEWFFYCSLPLLALIIKITPPVRYIALGFVSIAGMVWYPNMDILILVPFLSGITAAFLVRSDWFQRFAVRRMSSLISLSCVGLAVSAFPSAYEITPLILLSVAFWLIASGNSLFGILVNPVSRTLGEFSYGIYLLHSITLFAVFNFIIGLPESRALTPISHWLVVTGITPVLVFICFMTFRFIERPAMRSTATVTAWLRAHLTSRTTKRAASIVPPG